MRDDRVACEVTGHALFTSTPFVGHLGPLLTQADELVCRGWRVSVACLEDGRPLTLTHPGIDFLTLGATDLDQNEIDSLRDKITVERSFSRSMLTIIGTLARGWTETYARLSTILQQHRAGCGHRRPV